MAVVVNKAKEFTSLVPPKEKASKNAEPVEFTPHPPRLYINDVDVPALNGLTVGGAEIELTFKCRLVEMGVRETPGGKKRRNYEIEFLGVAR